jgi:hypothetical protein
MANRSKTTAAPKSPNRLSRAIDHCCVAEMLIARAAIVRCREEVREVALKRREAPMIRNLRNPMDVAVVLFAATVCGCSGPAGGEDVSPQEPPSVKPGREDEIVWPNRGETYSHTMVMKFTAE